MTHSLSWRGRNQVVHYARTDGAAAVVGKGSQVGCCSTYGALYMAKQGGPEIYRDQSGD